MAIQNPIDIESQEQGEQRCKNFRNIISKKEKKSAKKNLLSYEFWSIRNTKNHLKTKTWKHIFFKFLLKKNTKEKEVI